MGRAPCCDKANVKKGPWSPEEDAKLKEFMDKYGTGGNWIALPQKAGLKRCGKSCRLRWLNYLRPNIKHGEFSDEEDKIICTLYATIGSRWSIIAAQLPGRTDNDIKNYWNTKLKKKLMGMMTIPSKYSSHPPFSSTFQTQSLSLSSVSQLYRDFNSFYLQNAKYLQPNPATSPQNLLYSNSNNNSDTFSLTPSHYPYFSQNQEGFADLQCYSNGIESNNNNNNMLVFGGGNEASCSSSDGSCSHGKDRVKQEEIGGGFQGLIYGGENPKFMLHNGMDEILGSSHHELQLQMQRDVEEVKQLISSGNNNNSSSVGNGSNSSFMFNHDDDEREMYYF